MIRITRKLLVAFLLQESVIRIVLFGKKSLSSTFVPSLNSLSDYWPGRDRTPSKAVNDFGPCPIMRGRLSPFIPLSPVTNKKNDKNRHNSALTQKQKKTSLQTISDNSSETLLGDEVTVMACKIDLGINFISYCLLFALYYCNSIAFVKQRVL